LRDFLHFNAFGSETVIKSKKKKTSLNSYHHGNLAHEILETAILLIEKDGIEKLSLRQAAAICNVSAAAVYRHFGSKDELLMACATEGYARLSHAMKVSSPDLRRELDEIGIRYLSFAYKHPKLFTFMFNADLSQATNEQQMVFLQSYQRLREVIEKGLKEGIFMGSVDTITAKAWSLVHGFATLVIAGRLAVDNFANYLKLAQEVFASSIE
jgi:AcrR family transcriptional regulator